MESRTLIVEDPNGTRRVVPVEKPIIRLGRSAENEIVLTDPEMLVSRQHASLEFDESGASIRDAGSVNGTYVNDQRVTGLVRLQKYDIIKIGGHTIEFRQDTGGKLPWTVETGGEDLDAVSNTGSFMVSQIGSKSLQRSQIEKLEMLYDVGIALARAQTATEVIERAVHLLFKVSGVQRATLWLWKANENCFDETPIRSVAPHSIMRGAFDPQNVALSTTVLNHVRNQNRALLIRDVKSSQFSGSDSLMRAGIQAALCAPLNSQGSFLGVLYADNVEKADAFSPEEFRAFAIIASQTGLALAIASAREELTRKQAEHAALRCYLPPQVVDLIAASGGSLTLGGTVQPVTVLFADIRGFTQLSERMDAREVVNLLNEFFSIMTQEIFRAGGTLDKFMGDAVMALFGAPLPHPRSPTQALVAAVRMQQQMTKLNAERTQRGETPLAIGIGLHHGPAVVGNIGSAERMQYTAIGDTVNVAARLVGRAEPGQILISETMYNAAAASELFQDVGVFSLKGRHEQLHAYSIAWQRIAALR